MTEDPLPLASIPLNRGEYWSEIAVALDLLALDRSLFEVASSEKKRAEEEKQFREPIDKPRISK